VIRSVFLSDQISWHGQAERLRSLLQRSLVVVDLVIHAALGKTGRFNEARDDKFPCGIEPRIQINSCDHGLECVSQERPLFTATAHLFATPELKKAAELQRLRHTVQVGRAYQVSLQLREAPLGVIGIPADQALAHHKTKYRVAKKFQLFVIDEGIVGGLAFKRKRFVCQSADEQFPIMERASKLLLQVLQIRTHRDAVTV